MEDLFLPSNKLIMVPKENSNGIYVVLMGKVAELPNN